MRKRGHQFIGLLAFTLVMIQASVQSVCTMDSSYNYNSNNVLTSKDYYFYDANGWQTEWLTKDSVNGSWVMSHRYTYTCNLTGKQIGYLTTYSFDSKVNTTANYNFQINGSN